MLIDAEVQGVGFPLACDFLKELGFANYGKPDVHIIEIFEASGLVAKGATNYQILKAISRIADSTGFFHTMLISCFGLSVAVIFIITQKKFEIYEVGGDSVDEIEHSFDTNKSNFLKEKGFDGYTEWKYDFRTSDETCEIYDLT